MYKRLRERFVEFINSEEGRVGVKTSLSLGLVGGGILLMQTMFLAAAAAEVHFVCFSHDECLDDQHCRFWQDSQGYYHSDCFDN